MFKFVQDGDVVTVEMRVDEGVTWWELSDHFFNFLQASGYVITRQDFAEYWADQLDEYPEDDDIPELNPVSEHNASPATSTSSTFNFQSGTTPYSYNTVTITPATMSVTPGSNAFSSMVNQLTKTK